jgi:hypothetical protein
MASKICRPRANTSPWIRPSSTAHSNFLVPFRLFHRYRYIYIFVYIHVYILILDETRSVPCYPFPENQLFMFYNNHSLAAIYFSCESYIYMNTYPVR